jgi:hypothetical protein
MRSRTQADGGKVLSGFLWRCVICFLAGVAADSPDCPPRLQSQTSSPPLCSICLEPPQRAVETNCGHMFCAQCILMHWNHDRYPQPCRCPICRRNVSCKSSPDYIILLPIASHRNDANFFYETIFQYSIICLFQYSLISFLSI